MSPECPKRQIAKVLQKYQQSVEIDVKALLIEIRPLFGRISDGKYRYAGKKFESTLVEIDHRLEVLIDKKWRMEVLMDIESLKARIRLSKSDLNQDREANIRNYKLAQIDARLLLDKRKIHERLQKVIARGIILFDCGSMNGFHFPAGLTAKDKALDHYIQRMRMVVAREWKRTFGPDRERRARRLTQALGRQGLALFM